MSGNHWSDEQLIDHLYGIGPGDRHVAACANCQARLQAIQASRARVEASFAVAVGVSHEMLAAQRRAIYRRIDAERSQPWRLVVGRAWAAAVLAVALLGGGWMVHERSRTMTTNQLKISDTELVEQVSQIADNPEPQPAAPIEALFED